jgi:hypothetical protein
MSHHRKSYQRDVTSEDNPFVGFYLDTATFPDVRSGQIVQYEFVNDSQNTDAIVEYQLPDQDRTSKNWGVQANMSLFDLSNWYDLAAAGVAREKARLWLVRRRGLTSSRPSRI